jgi:RimJ/RimL family protein N-acetyltransferase
MTTPSPDPRLPEPGAPESKSFDTRKVELHGAHASLVPLTAAHAAGLCAIGRDPSGWEHMSRGPFADVADARSFIETAWAERDALPFAIFDRASGALAGTTRYFDVRRAHRGLEIGHTWLAPFARRTPLNTECKLLLLAHAFEELGAYRVQLKTDARNVVSQRAIERLGATREGVLRKHLVVRDGFVRDTVMYSITCDEWPLVRARLEALLARP